MPTRFAVRIELERREEGQPPLSFALELVHIANDAREAVEYLCGRARALASTLDEGEATR